MLKRLVGFVVVVVIVVKMIVIACRFLSDPYSRSPSFVIIEKIRF